MIEWSVDSINHLNPISFLSTDDSLYLGFSNGVVLKINSLKHIEFVFGGHGQQYPIDYLFSCDFDGENFDDKSQKTILAINRIGSLILISANDGRCLLYNELSINSIFNVHASKDKAWIILDDGVLHLVNTESVKIVSTCKISLSTDDSIISSSYFNDLLFVLTRSRNIMKRFTISFIENFSISEVHFDVHSDITNGKVEHQLGEEECNIVLWSNKRILYGTHSIQIDRKFKYLSEGFVYYPNHGEIENLDNKQIFRLPDLIAFKDNFVLFKNDGQFCIFDLKCKEESIFKVEFEQKSDISLTYFDSSTLTAYKGYKNGSVKRVLMENLFKTSEAEDKLIEFHGQHPESPVTLFYISRKTAKVWTGHENGLVCQWNPMLQKSNTVITGCHSQDPVNVLIESPEEWSPKIIVSVSNMNSLSVIRNDGNPIHLADLALEYGKVVDIMWILPSKLVVLEKNSLAKVWNFSSADAPVLDKCIEEANELKAYDPRHIDNVESHIKHFSESESDCQIVKAYRERWIFPFGQLYTVDLRRLLSVDSKDIGREEEEKYCHAILEALESNTISLGSIGANNQISLTTCPKNSHLMFGLLNLCINCLRAKLGLELKLQEKLPSSLSLLCKYWQDHNVYLRRAARYLIKETLEMLSVEQRESTVRFWRKLLPKSQHEVQYEDQHQGVNRNINRSMNRAAIVLAIMTVNGFMEESRLISSICEELLNLLVAEEGRDMFRMAAMELLGEGIGIWCDHVHLGSLFRLVISWSFALSPLRGEKPSMEGSSGEFSYRVVSETFEKIILWDCNHEGKLMGMWCKDLSNSPSTMERLVSIELLHELVQKPELRTAIRRFLPQIIETIVKVLDPSNMEEREKLRPGIIPVLHSIVTNFEVVSFDQESQQLAVASQSQVWVYDLKSSTRTAFFEAPAPVEQLINKKNKIGGLVRISKENRQLILWNINSTGSGFLGGILSRNPSKGISCLKSPVYGLIEGILTFQNNNKLSLVLNEHIQAQLSLKKISCVNGSRMMMEDEEEESVIIRKGFSKISPTPRPDAESKEYFEEAQSDSSDTLEWQNSQILKALGKPPRPLFAAQKTAETSDCADLDVLEANLQVEIPILQTQLDQISSYLSQLETQQQIPQSGPSPNVYSDFSRVLSELRFQISSNSKDDLSRQTFRRFGEIFESFGSFDLIGYQNLQNYFNSI